MSKCSFSDIYREYNQTIKPLIAQIEATQERLPIPVLNEIRAIHDHIARCYFDDVDEEFKERQLECARGHNMRIILDCLKILNSLYREEMSQLEKRVNIERIDSGKFYIKYAELANEAEKLTYNAKIAEAKSKLEAIEFFQESTAKYNEIHHLIQDNKAEIAWARLRFYEKPFWSVVLMILGAILGFFLDKFIP